MIDIINQDLKRRGHVIAYIVQNDDGVQIIQYNQKGVAAYVSDIAKGEITISERITDNAVRPICELK